MRKEAGLTLYINYKSCWQLLIEKLLISFTDHTAVAFNINFNSKIQVLLSLSKSSELITDKIMIKF